jgi:hypothetical protein
MVTVMKIRPAPRLISCGFFCIWLIFSFSPLLRFFASSLGLWGIGRPQAAAAKTGDPRTIIPKARDHQ